ncbi:MAG: PAS domain-containing protein [Elusimicrobiaceae bacterium]|nr:PAS domain-containing protein [Elusimicrobiaceae bacterium]
MENWADELDAGVTVIDGRGVIVYMNGKAAKIFERFGGERLVGKNALECHPEPARTKLAELLQTPRVNAYTIEKNGVRKLIYQAPWRKDGKFGGIVELSLELPAEMPHHVRKP